MSIILNLYKLYTSLHNTCYRKLYYKGPESPKGVTLSRYTPHQQDDFRLPGRSIIANAHNVIVVCVFVKSGDGNRTVRVAGPGDDVAVGHV
jgi:hypothetical protein